MGARRVLILTGEPSGDLAAGPVAAEILRAEPDVRMFAVGGGALRAAGCEIIQDIADLGAMGFAEILRQVPRLRALERKLRSFIDEVRPHVVLPVDYPGLNLRIAAHARRRGVPVVYYIGPQVWAWGSRRVPRIARVVNRMLVVFPFEVEIYREAGMKVDFVGHPLLDRLASVPARAECRRRLGLAAETTVLGLVPGSRAQEVRRILPVMAAAAAAVRRRRPGLEIVASVVDSVPRRVYQDALGLAGDGIRLAEGGSAVTARAADVLLVTSGTATLEAALLGAPLAVLYRTSPLTWFLGRRLVRIPRISLVNILAGEELVREFLQDDAESGPIAEHVEGLLAGEGEALSRRLRPLVERLGEPGVARRVAAAVLEEALP